MNQKIVVLDRGWVFVGDVEESEDRIVITKCRNIRRWGTTKGLGELRTGPTNDTMLDETGTVEAYKRAVICMIPCTGF